MMKHSKAEIKRQLKKAIDMSKKFFGFDPRKLSKAIIKWPKALWLIGGCARVDYVNDKWDGEPTQYYHYFESDVAVYAFPEPQEDGSNILLIKGKFKITADGLDG